MIVNVRVDHRLLHGQVAMAWNQVLGSDCILIANDSVPNDEIRKAGIKRGIIRMCEQVAASGNTLILYSA